MRVLVRNGITFEVIAVSYAYSENSELYIQDICGDRFCISGFNSPEEVSCCLMELFRVGSYDFTGYDSVKYCDVIDYILDYDSYDGGDD